MMSTDYTPTVRQAFRDWNEQRAYIDSGGNYRVRPEAATPTHRPKGKIAPWNREVKRLFPSSAEFHAAARAVRRLEPHRFEPYHGLTEICRYCNGSQFADYHQQATIRQERERL